MFRPFSPEFRARVSAPSCYHAYRSVPLYLHYDLGGSGVTAVTIVPALPASTLTATQRVDGDIVRGTLSYRFN
jgi:hypothetical protein